MTSQSEMLAALQQENAILKQEIAELKKAAEEAQQNRILLEAVVEHSPSNISVIDLEKRFLLVNPAGEQAMGMNRASLLGKTQHDLFGNDVVAEWDLSDQQVLKYARSLSVEHMMPLADGDHYFLAIKFPIVDEHNYVYAIGSIVTDVTEQKRVDQARLTLQQQIIDAQQATLRELSTPLVPIADSVVAMVLIGKLDARQTQQMIETLLEGISFHQSATAIIDITGVKVVDTHVAYGLLQAARAADLLGAKVIITGISSEVAMSFVQLGADLSRINTRSTLQSGIAYALGSQD